MPITKINSLGITNPVAFSAGTAALPSITFSGDTNTGVFAPTADTIGFAEGGAEAMRINSSGNVGIGTTTQDVRLQVNTATVDAHITNLKLSQNSWGESINKYKSLAWGDPTTLAAIGVLFDGGAANMAWHSFYNGGYKTETTVLMTLTGAGSLILAGSTAQKASGTTWSNPSDTRLKDNKQNYAKGLQELLQINVKTWEWNGKAGTTQGDVGIGIIADEIETILPNTIDTYKAKLNKDDIEETDVKRFDATEITWLLLNSVKEQQAIIEQLKATSTSQQTKIDALEARLTALESN